MLFYSVALGKRTMGHRGMWSLAICATVALVLFVKNVSPYQITVIGKLLFSFFLEWK